MTGPAQMDRQATQTYTGVMIRTVRVRAAQCKGWGLCSIPECGMWGRLVRGWCGMHYWRWQHHADTEALLEVHHQHGMHATPEYRAWEGLIQRTTNPRHRSWKNYGGRGITVCQSWRDSFEAFFKEIGSRPGPEHSLDRYPDNDGNYEPGNVRWATRAEQEQNKRKREGCTSRYKGVYWYASKNRWAAEYKTKNQHVHLGYFELEEDAHIARELAMMTDDALVCC